MYRVKIKQITSGSELSGKTIISNGSGGFLYKYPQIEKGITFPESPINGDLFYYLIDNIVYQYDSVRSKWLSVKTTSLSLGRSSISENISAYLGVADAVHSSTTGVLMPRNGTILNVTVDNISIMGADRDIEVRVNDSNTNKITVTILSGNKSANVTNGNIDFNTNDFINVIAIASGTSPALINITVLVEIAWIN
jgi:hypothetical protein